MQDIKFINSCLLNRFYALFTALIQIIAASHANRQVCYFTFGDEKLCSDINEIIEILIENDVETGMLNVIYLKGVMFY